MICMRMTSTIIMSNIKYIFPPLDKTTPKYDIIIVKNKKLIETQPKMNAHFLTVTLSPSPRFRVSSLLGG